MLVLIIGKFKENSVQSSQAHERVSRNVSRVDRYETNQAVRAVLRRTKSRFFATLRMTEGGAERQKSESEGQKSGAEGLKGGAEGLNLDSSG